MARRGNIYNKDKKKSEEVNVIQEKLKKNKSQNSGITKVPNEPQLNIEETDIKENMPLTDEEIHLAEESAVSTEVENVSVEEKVEDNITKVKKRNKRQIAFLVIFILCVVTITAIKAVIKYNELNPKEENSTSNLESINTDDSKYGITDYKEMYYINPIEIKDEDYYKERNNGNNRTDIDYVTISGLKNKELQTRINKEIKDIAYKYYNDVGNNEGYMVYTTVTANFSNVLSIEFTILMWNDDTESYRIDEQYALNYNLVTGEKISFSDVFAGNTPMNYIIYNMAYQTLAWDTEIDFDADEIDWDKHTNMDNRDTSEYEDIILKNIRDFEKIDKEDIEFYISPARIYVKMRLGNNEDYAYAGIPSYQYAEYITIYKRFLVSDDKLKETYEELPSKRTLVFSENLGIDKYYEEHVYDNLYVVMSLLDAEDYDEEYYADYPEALKILKDQIVERTVIDILNKQKALAESNKKYGYIVRVMLDTYLETFKNDFGEEEYIVLYIEKAVDRSKIDYYNTFAFKSLAARVMSPKVDVSGALLGEIDDKNITRLEKESDFLTYYYDANGKIIATDWDELEVYMENKYREPVVEEPIIEVEKEETNKEKEEKVDIYSEV